MNFKRTLFYTSALILVTTFFMAGSSYAAGSSTCQIIYGGGQVCPPEIKLFIDKMVQVAETSTTKGGDRVFTDNILVNDPKYRPSQTVTFSIKIQNNGSSKLEKVEVVDFLPDFLTFESGPGSVDSAKKKVTYTVSNLEPAASDTQKITAKIADTASFPADKGIVCVTNQSQAQVNGSVVTDTAQVCIEKDVIGAKVPPTVFEAPKGKVSPPTGPEMLPLLALLPGGALGIFLRKKTRLQ